MTSGFDGKEEGVWLLLPGMIKRKDDGVWNVRRMNIYLISWVSSNAPQHRLAGRNSRVQVGLAA